MVAYVQYMTNVRRRKEAVWMDVGPKRRRKNAITKIHFFEGEGISSSRSTLKLFLLVLCFTTCLQIFCSCLFECDFSVFCG